jgi:putative ABC transport system permease protein
MKFNPFNTIILIGAVQGFWLAALFFTSKKLNRKSNFFLATLLLSISINNLANILFDTGATKLYPIIEFLPLNWTLLIPFSFYYFIQFLSNPNYQLRRSEYLQLIPFALLVIFKCIMLSAYRLSPEWLQIHYDAYRSFIRAMEGVGVIYLIWVLVMAYRKLTIYQASLQNEFADIERKSLAWLQNIIRSISALWVLWMVPYVYASIQGVSIHSYLYPLWVGMTVIVYWLAYSMHSRRDLFEFTPAPVVASENLSEPTSKELPEKAEHHYQNLKRIMEEEKLFLDADINMTVLAEKMQLSNGYLSQIINQREGLNFYDYINRYRVEEVKKYLTDPKYSHLSLLGIAMEAGFKSKSTFNLVFKKLTGKTPSEFKNQL